MFKIQAQQSDDDSSVAGGENKILLSCVGAEYTNINKCYQNINFCVIRSHVTQTSEITYSDHTQMLHSMWKVYLGPVSQSSSIRILIEIKKGKMWS